MDGERSPQQIEIAQFYFMAERRRMPELVNCCGAAIASAA
jgi:hypothetical protein